MITIITFVHTNKRAPERGNGTTWAHKVKMGKNAHKRTHYHISIRPSIQCIQHLAEKTRSKCRSTPFDSMSFVQTFVRTRREKLGRNTFITRNCWENSSRSCWRDCVIDDLTVSMFKRRMRRKGERYWWPIWRLFLWPFWLDLKRFRFQRIDYDSIRQHKRNDLKTMRNWEHLFLSSERTSKL